MPRPKPFVALHGQVDFNSMIAVAAPVDSDIFVCRQGAQGNNVFTTRAQIRNPAAGEQFLAQDGSAAAPGYAFVNVPNMGIFRGVGSTLIFSTVGIARFQLDASTFRSALSTAPAISATAGSTTIPVIRPNSSSGGDIDTGIGSGGLDEWSAISGGVEVTRFVEAAGVVQFIVPLQNNAAFPSIAFGIDNTGIYQSSAGTLNIAIAGVNNWRFTSTNFGSGASGGARLLRTGVSDILPSVTPNSDDSNTGMGWRATDIGVLIAGAQNCMEFGESGGAPLIAFYGTAAIALQTGVAVTAAAIHAALVNLNLITA